MLSFSWRQWIKQYVVAPNRPRTGSPRKREWARQRLIVELLEDRLAPAAVIWTGNAGDNNWGTAGNWEYTATGATGVPTSSDDVTINKSGAGTITIAGGSYSVRSLNDTTASLSIGSGASLSLAAVAAPSTFGQNVTVQSGGTLNVGANASVQIGSSGFFAVTLLDDGTLSFASGDTVTLGTADATGGIEVGNGGTLDARNDTFNAGNSSTANQLLLDAGSSILKSDGSDAVTDNIFNITLSVPAIDVPLLTNNQTFQDVDINAGDSLTNGQSVTFTQMGTVSKVKLYVFAGNFTINAGASLTVDPNVPVQLAPPGFSSETLLDDGTLSFASGDTVTLGTADATAKIEVGYGGTLGAKGATFNTANSSTTPQLVLDAGSILSGTEVTGNIFNITLSVPAIDVPLLTNNQTFQDVDINAGDSLTNGQSVNLTSMGTVSKVKLYVFVGNFTINAGATLAVGANVPVQIGLPNFSTVTLTDDGTLSFASGDTVTLGTTESTAKIEVGKGGTLGATNAIFNAASNSTASQLVFDAGSSILKSDGSDAVTGNSFNITLSVPAIDVPLLTNNQSFQDVDINAGDSLANGQSVTLTSMGTVSKVKLYVFAGNFTINAGASLTVDPNVPVQIGLASFSTETLTDDGTLDANNVTFNAGSNNTAKVVVNSGGVLQLSDSSFPLSSLWLNSGSTDTLQFVRFASQIDINSGAVLTASSNDFSNVPTNGIIATGTASATINLINNYWGTTDPTQIIEDHNKDKTRPYVQYQPYDPDRPVHTIAAAASTTYSSAAQNVTLSASATSPSGTVIEGTVTFTVKNGSTTIGTAQGTVSNGTASASFTLPAGQAVGSYTIAVSYSDSGALFEDGGDTSGILSVKQSPLTVTAIALNKPSDGTTTAYVILSADTLGSDQVTESYTKANFASAGPGNNITVTVSGISISGASAGNYLLENTTATATANIVQTTNPVYTYDSKGRIIGEVYTNGNVFERVFASDGSSTATLTNSTTGTVSSGVISDAYAYNAQGQLTAFITYYSNGNVFSHIYNSDGSSTATLKDSKGNLLDDYTYNTKGQLTAYDVYYSNGNVFHRTYNSDGSSTATLKDSNGNLIQTYNYNTKGQLASIDYANGNVLAYTYNSDGTSTSTLKTSSGVLLDDYSYNAKGQLAKYDTYASNGNVYSRTYSFDTNGKVTGSTATLTNPTTHTVASGVTSEAFTYNAQGQLAAYNYNYTNGNVFSRTYSFDTNGNVTGSTATLKNSSGELLADYSYNAKGVLTAYDTYASNGNVLTRTYSFDTNGNATGSTATLTNPTTGTVASGVTSESYTYNAQGVVTAYVYYDTDGNVFSRTYDSDGDGTSYGTLANSSGTILDYYEWDSNGKLIYGPSPIKPSPWPPT